MIWLSFVLIVEMNFQKMPLCVLSVVLWLMVVVIIGVISVTPDDGKEYLVFFFTVENISDEDVYISTYDFDGYVDDTAIYESVILGTIDGYEEIGGNLAVGKKANGYLAFEVNTNWKKFEVHYKNDYLDSSDSMVFEVVNDDSQSSGV